MWRIAWVILVAGGAWYSAGHEAARAEEPTAPLRLEVTISHRHPAVQPPPNPEFVTKEAEQAVRELEARQRDEEALRQSIPKPSPRPDLNYDVWSGIQSRSLTNALRR